jgi:hypothetical protein
MLLGMALPTFGVVRTLAAETGKCPTKMVRITLASEQISFCAPTGQPYQVVEDNIAVPEVRYAQLNQVSGYGIVNIKSVTPGYAPGIGTPVYTAGDVDTYRQAIRNMESINANLIVSNGPAAVFSNESVPGLEMDTSLAASSGNGKIRTLEWDVERASRLWSIVIAWDTGMVNSNEWEAASKTFTIQESDIANVPDTAINLGAALQASKTANITSGVADITDVKTPAWWDGVCDANNFYKATNDDSFPLGNPWHGVLACGPRTSVARNPNPVHFTSNAWGEYEFECVELVMRFLYQEWGIEPWAGNANTIKDSPPDSIIFFQNDGTHAIVPGDIITEEAPSGNYGHAVIVTDVNVDGTGTGTISILEQNSSPSGIRSLSVDKWSFSSDPWTLDKIQGWLHVKVNTTTPTPTLTPSRTNTPTKTLKPSLTPTRTITLTPSVTSTPSNTPTITLTPAPAVPDVPIMLSPAYNGLITSYTPRLDWREAAWADHYRVQMSTSSTFSSPLLDQNNVLVSGYQLTSPLAPNTTYFWHVQAINSIGQTSAWSSTWSFRTAILPPSLRAPANAVLLNNKRPAFTWYSVSGSTSYTLEVSSLSNFASKTINTSPTVTSYTPTSDLAVNTKFYWRVKANGTNGPSLYSQVRTFTTGNPPSVPTLISPAANALVLTTTPLLDWSTSSLPSGTSFAYYQVQVATSSAFSSPIVNTSSLTSLTASQLTRPVLASNTKFYWRVRAVNTVSGVANLSAWSSVRYFRTALLPPALSLPVNGGSVTTLRPTLDWKDVSGVTGYTIQVSMNKLFSSLLVNVSPAGTLSAYTPAVNLPTGVPLYWRVQSRGTNGPGAWSAVFTFTVNP